MRLLQNSALQTIRAQEKNDHPPIPPITQTPFEKRSEEKCDLGSSKIKNRWNPRNLWIVFSELRGILQEAHSVYPTRYFYASLDNARTVVIMGAGEGDRGPTEELACNGDERH